MTEPAHILIVDDDPGIRRMFQLLLGDTGYRVSTAGSGEEALAYLELVTPDLILMDLVLPGMSGQEVTVRVKSDPRKPFIPILLVTARSDQESKVTALDAGADDFLTKPFGIKELLARIRAALRRAGGGRTSREAVLEHGAIRMDLERRAVTVEGRPVHLTPKEYDTLHYLLTNVGKLVTHTALLRAVWGPEYTDSRPYLHVFIGQLRRKIEPDPARPRYIVTEPGVGYRLADP